MDRTEYLYQRRNRCVGRLLGELETLVPEELMGGVRRAVKTRMSEYHTDVLDVLENSPSTVFNSYAIKVKDRIGNTS